MIKIKLRVFWNTDEATKLEMAGIEYDMEDPMYCEKREMIFYRIDYQRPFSNKNYTVISVAGEQFIVDMECKALESKIENQLVYKFN